jgi:hypothetical protein
MFISACLPPDKNENEKTLGSKSRDQEKLPINLYSYFFGHNTVWTNQVKGLEDNLENL